MIAAGRGQAVRAFVEKELRVALGQRRLILALVVGPFLLLIFFGIGFTGSSRQMEAYLVTGEGPQFAATAGMTVSSTAPANGLPVPPPMPE